MLCYGLPWLLEPIPTYFNCVLRMNGKKQDHDLCPSEVGKVWVSLSHYTERARQECTRRLPAQHPHLQDLTEFV